MQELFLHILFSQPFIVHQVHKILLSQTQTTNENIGKQYWCSCNSCLTMNTYTESTCCRDYLNSGEIPEKIFEGMCPFDFDYFANDLFPLLTRYLSTQAPYQ